MADNVNITAGTGTIVATDQVGTDHYQKMKLADGTADSSTMIAADGGVEANALRVTIANDSTGVLEVVQDTAGDFNCTETNSSDIKTALELLDNAIDGNYLNTNMNLAGTDAQAGEGVISASTLRVTIATDDDGVAHLATIAGDTTSIDGKITACNTGAVVLAAGSDAIGKLAANSGVDIGDVDVTSIVPGTAATNLGKAEDAAHSTGDVGVAMLAVRQDSLASLCDTDGDYAPLQVSSDGALYVTGSAGSTQYAEDAAHVSGNTGTMALAVRNDALASLCSDDGDYAPLQVSADGALFVEIAADSVGGFEVVQDTAADFNCTEANSGDIKTAVELLDNAVDGNYLNVNCNIAGTDIVGGAGVVAAGVQRITLASDDPAVALLTTMDADTGNAVTALQIIDDWDATHASAAPTDGVMSMGAAYNTALPTDVGADADAARLLTDRYGRLCIGKQPQSATAILNNADTTTARELVAAVASRKVYITSMIISVDTAGNYWLEDGDAVAVSAKMYFAANGGCAIHFPEGTPLKTPTVNKALNVKGSVAGNVGVTITYYLAE